MATTQAISSELKVSGVNMTASKCRSYIQRMIRDGLLTKRRAVAGKPWRKYLITDKGREVVA